MSRDHDIIYTLLVASMFLFYVTSTMSCCVVWKSTTMMRDRYSLWLLQRRKLGCVLVARSYGVFVGLGYRVFTMKWVIAFRQKKNVFLVGQMQARVTLPMTMMSGGLNENHSYLSYIRSEWELFLKKKFGHLHPAPAWVDRGQGYSILYVAFHAGQSSKLVACN